MFSSDERQRLRSDLLNYGSKDKRISGAAITGSAAATREDRWSDIDLAFGVEDGSELPSVLSDWTEYMYQQHLAVHHFDVRSGGWIYRVFLLTNTLQVDLAFVSATDFRALAPTFQLMFGAAKESRHAPPPAPGDIIGLAWLHALHARSCLARQKPWQAEYMISGIRDNALALACIRHGLPAVYGRGMDLLPSDVISQFAGTLIQHLDAAELSRVFRLVIHGLLGEIRRVDMQLAERLEGPLTLLIEAPS